MYNTSASELEGVASDLGQIARTYTNAVHTLDQQVITLEGAVAHVLNDGVMQWKGLSSEAFVSAWLERRTRLMQASDLMSRSAADMTTLVQAIESHLSIIRAGQSIQTQAMFASMASNDQQAVLDEVSQAQNAIFMAMTALNSQLEALAAEVGNCPEVDRNASTPGLLDNVNRNDAGGDVPPEGGTDGGDGANDGNAPADNTGSNLENNLVIQSQGREEVQHIREENNLTSNRQMQKNVSVAKYNIDGTSGDMQAISGPEKDGFVNGPAAGQNHFDPPGTGNNPRTADTEYKILEKIADDHWSNDPAQRATVTGEVSLYTERIPCASCQDVIRQFKEAFPNVRVYVGWG